MIDKIKIAAYSYILFSLTTIVFPIFFYFAEQKLFFSILYFILCIIFLPLIYRGFIEIGKKLKNNFLTNISKISIVTGILHLAYYLFGNSLFNDLAYFGTITYLTNAIILGGMTVLFGVSLFRIRKKLKYAKSAGILNIIAGCTLFIGLGLLLLIPAIILEILLLFEASRTFEINGKTNKKSSRRAMPTWLIVILSIFIPLIALIGFGFYIFSGLSTGDDAIAAMNDEERAFLDEVISNISQEATPSELVDLIGAPSEGVNVRETGLLKWDYPNVPSGQLRVYFYDGKVAIIRWISLGKFVYEKKFNEALAE